MIRDLLSPPNLLSLLRLLAAPWLVSLILDGQCEMALYLCLACGASDFADGFVARRFGLDSQLGAYLDPIADKVLLVSLYVCFGLTNLVPQWLTALVVGRDLLILILAGAGMLFTARREYPPTLTGKLSTLVQIASSLVFLGSCARWAIVPSWLPQTAQLLVAATAIISGVHYSIRAVLWSRETPSPEA